MDAIPAGDNAKAQRRKDEGNGKIQSSPLVFLASLRHRVFAIKKSDPHGAAGWHCFEFP